MMKTNKTPWQICGSFNLFKSRRQVRTDKVFLFILRDDKGVFFNFQI